MFLRCVISHLFRHSFVCVLIPICRIIFLFFYYFLFTVTATTEIYPYGHTLSLPDALPIFKASEKGAYDYLPKPFDLTELIAIIGRALAEPKRKPARLEDDMQDGMPLVGRSAAMQEIYRVLARLMQTDLTLLITGESGTGKELVARAPHVNGKGRNGPLVAFNMAAFPRDLFESELFGQEKAAFTGAQNRSTGRFAPAEGR